MSLLSKLRIRSHVRLFLVFMLSFLIPLAILTTVFLSSYRRIYENESQQGSCREMDSVAATMDAQFESVSTYLSLICRDEILQDLLLVSNNGMDPVSTATNDISRTILRYNTTLPRLLNPKTFVLTAHGQVLFGQEYLAPTFEISALLNMLEKSTPSPLSGTIWLSAYQFKGYTDNDDYVYVAHVVRDPSNWHTVGYVMLRFRTSDLVSIYLNSSNRYRSICVMDSLGNMVSSIDTLGTNATVIEAHKLRLMMSNEAINIDGLTAYVNTLCNQWYLMSVTETGTVAQPKLTATITMYAVALLFCVALTLVISYVASKRFTKPVGQLIAGMKKAEQGDLQSRVYIQTHDEFEELSISYNKMIGRIEELMKQIIFEQEQKRISDMRMLQSQINPHFLYNTLGSIRYMVYASPPQDVDAMLLSLTKFLNYVLSGAEVHASLDRELEQMETYINIQRFGFDVPLRYEVDIGEGLGHYQIVKMLLQPLVENAVLHGLKLNSVDPLLQIKVRPTEKEMIQITISDNGPGFDPAALSQKQKEKSSHHHLGIANIRQRLWLHYGESYTFDITSSKGHGTIATLCIPKLTEEDVCSENTHC